MEDQRGRRTKAFPWSNSSRCAGHSKNSEVSTLTRFRGSRSRAERHNIRKLYRPCHKVSERRESLAHAAITLRTSTWCIEQWRAYWEARADSERRFSRLQLMT